MDATYGDTIMVEFPHLDNTHAVIGIGKDYESELTTFEFNKSVSADKPGSLTFKYPLKGFIVFTYKNYTLPKPPVPVEVCTNITVPIPKPEPVIVPTVNITNASNSTNSTSTDEPEEEEWVQQYKIVEKCFTEMVTPEPDPFEPASYEFKMKFIRNFDPAIYDSYRQQIESGGKEDLTFLQNEIQIVNGQSVKYEKVENSEA
mmetsp:Transcript_5444/g.8436  ORF Transcript_5444/g.8436 Transcript_5444/m.8436 type:complete len:202 (+) Transcript_5444:445-1050(+)|eukprot:CAMPEP_0170499896 /NCGR_PEP_ID=MMETSP0208-20121228/32986_1 /TAXON_ID=197538 /ORGANISM="Strombidium inclinatum, Strain S3" /LENGTH=201 /DNA_ID=CAMNT_0010777655 /DNA_START=388 /DNA_END=993 /DNA_ORIENTATION=-